MHGLYVFKKVNFPPMWTIQWTLIPTGVVSKILHKAGKNYSKFLVNKEKNY